MIMTALMLSYRFRQSNQDRDAVIQQITSMQTDRACTVALYCYRYLLQDRFLADRFMQMMEEVSFHVGEK